MVQYSVASPSFQIPYRCPSTPRIKTLGLGYFPFRSPLLGESLLLSLPPATKMFQFAGFALSYLGLPHSDISGSMLASSSPERFVGRHVLHRLCVPRDSPLALCSLTSTLQLSIFNKIAARLFHYVATDETYLLYFWT